VPPISFARGAPSPECLDPELIADCAEAALARDGRTILAYGPGGGYGPLREVLAERHGVAPRRVFLTAGGLQGFVHYLAVQLGRRPGRVLVEGPSYDRPLKLLRLQGVETVALPMDDEGLDVDALESELDRGGEVSFLYSIPTFQNPSGRTLGLERRRRLAALVAERGLDVLEDDPYGAVRYDGEPQPSLHELEGGERVAFTSSFSKTVAPGLRVAWYVVPDELVASSSPRTTIEPSRPRSRRPCSRRRSCTSCSSAVASSRTWSGSAGCCGPAVMRCWLRSPWRCRTRSAGTSRPAATSSGSTSVWTRRRCSGARPPTSPS
jgi:2-aminoadipate transaminase